ncbi:MAG: hypothetical protein LBS44_03495 [Deltaproteobacteria bacterium]|jgi:hypothetical protein|nr:hypothetical protein [Deltaproteobacteria bacterium]
MTKNIITIRKLFYYAPLGIVIFIILATVVAIFNIKEKAHVDLVSHQYFENIYDIMTSVYPSNISNSLYDISNQRLSCYGSKPTNRLIGICNKQYLLSTLSIGRQKIDSAPNIGEFLLTISNCPIIYSICRGKEGGEDYCQKVEALCMDYVFDFYWRGIPFSAELSQAIL